jgi:hypothetical protein
MNQVQDLMQEIKKVGGVIQLKHGDRLRIEAPKGALTSEQKGELAIYKQDIIQILKDKAEAHCQGCQYHDTGQTPDGIGVMNWCGPFKEPGCTKWLNIAELTGCPLRKWGDVSKTVH